MKDILNRVVVALLFVIVASAPTFAKVHKSKITLKADTKVGEVLVKKGTYDVRFDDQTNEVSLWKGRKVVATSSVQTEPLTSKYPNSAHIVNLENDGARLTGIIFGGTSQTVVLKPATQATVKN
jgi:hypothetical protein